MRQQRLEWRHRLGLGGFPVVGEPLLQLAGGGARKFGQQVGQVMLRVDLVLAAGARQGHEDYCSVAAALVADGQAVLPVQHDDATTRFP